VTKRFSFLLGLGLTLLWAQTASALTFRVIPNDGLKRRVLLIYDCGWLATDSLCLEAESMFAAENVYSEEFEDDSERDAILRRVRALGGRFEVEQKDKRVYYEYAGDVVALRRIFSQDAFAEVWLLSGGGHVSAGLGIGKELRDKGAAVRVPSAARVREAGLELENRQPAECVSSCTIAFMGGVFRYIDDGASYQIHAGSKYLDLGGRRLDDIHKTLAAGGGGLQAIADEINKDARDSLRNDLVHFHDTLLLPLGERNTRTERATRDRELSAWVIAAPARFPYSAADRDRDRQVIESEGDAALQDIFMRLERRAIAVAVEDVRPLLPRLGRRADAALAMFVAMFDTASIKESNMMARETLVSMGYITEDVK
jgi:hypothetical protein